MLTIEEIRYLLALLSQDVVLGPTKEFPFTITRQSVGYSDDPIRGKLQAKLSIMGEVAKCAE